jgi:protoporphyrinogen oxidase
MELGVRLAFRHLHTLSCVGPPKSSVSAGHKVVATMVYTHLDHDLEDGTQVLARPSNDQITVHVAEYAQPLFHNGFQQLLNAYDQSLHQTVQAYQHHTLVTALFSQRQSSALGILQTEFASAYPEMV